MKATIGCPRTTDPFIAEERAQDILESIVDAVICTDISGKVTLLNRAAENMTGRVDRLIHYAQHDPFTRLPNRALLNVRVDRAIALARRKQGQMALLFWIWVISSASTIPL